MSESPSKKQPKLVPFEMNTRGNPNRRGGELNKVKPPKEDQDDDDEPPTEDSKDDDEETESEEEEGKETAAKKKKSKPVQHQGEKEEQSHAQKMAALRVKENSEVKKAVKKARYLFLIGNDTPFIGSVKLGSHPENRKDFKHFAEHSVYHRHDWFHLLSYSNRGRGEELIESLFRFNDSDWACFEDVSQAYLKGKVTKKKIPKIYSGGGSHPYKFDHPGIIIAFKFWRHCYLVDPECCPIICFAKTDRFIDAYNDDADVLLRMLNQSFEVLVDGHDHCHCNLGYDLVPGVSGQDERMLIVGYIEFLAKVNGCTHTNVYPPPRTLSLYNQKLLKLRTFHSEMLPFTFIRITASQLFQVRGSDDGTYVDIEFSEISWPQLFEHCYDRMCSHYKIDDADVITSDPRSKLPLPHCLSDADKIRRRRETDGFVIKPMDSKIGYGMAVFRKRIKQGSTQGYLAYNWKGKTFASPKEWYNSLVDKSAFYIVQPFNPELRQVEEHYFVEFSRADKGQLNRCFMVPTMREVIDDPKVDDLVIKEPMNAERAIDRNFPLETWGKMEDDWYAHYNRTFSEGFGGKLLKAAKDSTEPWFIYKMVYRVDVSYDNFRLNKKRFTLNSINPVCYGDLLLGDFDTCPWEYAELAHAFEDFCWKHWKQWPA